MSAITRIALIGFGEVGQAAAEALKAAGVESISAWDLKFAEVGSAPSRALARLGVEAGRDAASAVAGAELVISAVTAAQCVAAAQACAPGLAKDAFFLDLNSSSPEAKRAAAEAVEQAGGRYVEAAVMSPIEPKRLGSPMLLGGPHGEAFVAAAEGLGFGGARLYSDEIGRAAATKLCRSVMIKGVEALLCESLLAARRYGVEAEVLASLGNLLPAPDWPERARYMISRALEHGVRRAEEMREAARTVADAGLDPLMCEATAERQDWAAQRRRALDATSLEELLDKALEAAPPARETGA
jgi:3-hydroxyisobutyrate dehydrogenase-like beta-hydroxyacid dehydrogenase